MQHEIYADKIELAAASSTPMAPEAQSAIDRSNKLAKLGLSGELVAHQLQAAGLLEEQSLTVIPFDVDRYLVWRLFLADTFSSNEKASAAAVFPTNENGTVMNQSWRIQPVARYNRDAIPLPVLQIWERAFDSKLFERFEIWCRPDVQRDPLLVGVRKGAFYPLARWGVDDANFLSFEDVVKNLHDRFVTIPDPEGPILATVLSYGIGFGLVLGGILGASSFILGNMSCIVAGILLFAFARFIVWPWRNRLQMRMGQEHLRSSATGRAIAKFAKVTGK